MLLSATSASSATERPYQINRSASSWPATPAPRASRRPPRRRRTCPSISRWETATPRPPPGAPTSRARPCPRAAPPPGTRPTCSSSGTRRPRPPPPFRGAASRSGRNPPAVRGTAPSTSTNFVVGRAPAARPLHLARRSRRRPRPARAGPGDAGAGGCRGTRSALR